MVKTGLCKENIDIGDKIDLGKFPAPCWHELDGGRFISTLAVVVTKDPDTGIRNVSLIRQQILGKNKVTLNPAHHSGIHLRKYMAMNKPMPFAAVIGLAPEIVVVGAVNAPYGVDEFGIAGTLAGEPVPLIKCETVDLEVPATSEIVLEGEITLDQTKWEAEGPFGEHSGHFSTLKKEIKPAGYLTAVTYRNNPILQGCQPGIPPNEDASLKEMGHSTGLWKKLQDTGIPGIKDVYLTERGCGGFTLVISMSRQFYMGNVRQLIYAAFALHPSAKWVIVVDDDVDVFDHKQIEWALSVRVQPYRDIIITGNNCPGDPLDPSIHPNEMLPPNTRTSKIGIDATTKFKGFDFPPIVADSGKLQQKVSARWKEYGLG